MTPAVKQAVIMVGGKGTRLRPLTETKPKPILPVLDKPCLRYLIESLVSAGIKDIILACGYRSEQLVESIGNGSDMGITIEYSYEDEPRGTAGAVKIVEDRLDDVFVACNGDVFADIDVSAEIKEHFSSKAAITISLTAVENPCEFGIVRLDGTGRITEFKEKPKPEEVFSNLVNAGVYVVDKKVMKLVPEGVFFDLSKDLFPILMQRNDRLQGYVLSGVWRDVGRPSDLLGANLVMADKIYKGAKWPHFSKGKHEEPFYMGKDSKISDSSVSSSVVLAGCKVSGSTISGSMLMKGCTVEGATITNSILGDGCTVKRGAVIADSVLGDGTIIESGQRIKDSKVV